MKDNIIYLPIHLLVNTYWVPVTKYASFVLFYFIIFFLKQGLDSLEFACIG